MTLERITMPAIEPAIEPVSVAEMKAHLRLDHNEEDSLLNDFIIAARQLLERRLSLAFISARWRYRPRQGFSVPSGQSRSKQSAMIMPLFPIAEVHQMKLYLADGSIVFADLSALKIHSSARPAVLTDVALPTSVQPDHGVEVEFTAGYGANPEDVPSPLRLAIKMLAASFYENRIDSAQCHAVSLPATVSLLLMDYMEVRLK